MPHLPSPGRPVPVSTYRVQLRPPAAGHPGFGFDDAAAVVPYLADLGVTHLYCSPWLQAAPGSAHGYDVVDHARVNSELGGEPGLARLSRSCREAGLGIILDIVPNHMAVSEPQSQNAAWWGLLRDGRASSYASWFDVDWDSPANPGKVLVPVLGAPLGQCIGDLRVDGDRLRYFGHVLPLAPGSLIEGDLLATLERQHYRLCHWRVAVDELNYRRFFDVTTLAGLRVKVPPVFDATHALLLRQVADGVVDGLRIDHPDGLADPGGYLDRLADSTGGAWVVVEKILEPGEELPMHWATSGSTGYDALNRVLGLFVDPAGEQPLTDLWVATTGHNGAYDDVVGRAKRQVLSDVLVAEVERLADLAVRVCRAEPALRDTTRRGLREALVEVLASFPVYRAYLPPTGPADDVARTHVEHAVAAARRAVPHRTAELEVLKSLVLAEGPTGPDAQELVTRFQQTCGPVMAKGVEDTAFYRYLRLSALCEVGGDPSQWGLPVADWHDACAVQQLHWPLTMTTLSTHDTKRSEDVRARLVLLSQCPTEWGEAVVGWSAAAARHHPPDHAAEQLLWQTLLGAWPVSADRAVAYLAKATREAKCHTSWVDPDPAYDEALASFVRAVLADRALVAEVEAFTRRLDPAWRATSLAQKLVQLMMPGVADTYQGTEVWDLSLVDPDNRRPVDFDLRRALLADPADHLAADPAGAAKLRVVRAALRLRREQPGWFLEGATYAPLTCSARALAFTRSEQVAVVVPLRSVSVERHGWGEESVTLPQGRWRDLLSGPTWAGGPVRLADLLAGFPVALLVRA